MSRKGENIYKRKDGRWEARYIKGYTTSGQIHYGYCYGKTYRNVRRRYKQLELYSYRVPRLVRDSSICLDGYYYARCPSCQSSLGRDYQLYCDRCGQALDWSKWAEEY